MADQISITIDGVEIQTETGKMVLEAAIDAGLYVPYLCYHPGMKPYAACRMCVVSVEGGRGFPAACTLPVQDGMKVHSEAPAVQELRKSVMEMLIAEHPDGCLTCHRIDLCGPNDVCLRHVSVNDRCVTCPKNERCELKDTVRYLGMTLESPLDYKYRNIPLEVGDPFYDRDYNLCIVCGRCVRACQELRGDDAICFTERSGSALVGTSFGTSLLESGCEFCGACIDVCPVGALTERDHKWEKPARVERTICPHCPVGCQLNLEIGPKDDFIRAVPEINSPANRGQACFRGKFGLEFINGSGALDTPLMRRNGVLTECTWDEALDLLAAKLEEYKGPGFALLTSPDSTNEEHYLAQKFARTVMGSNNVDQTSNTHPELVEALASILGYPAATNPVWDLEQAGCTLVFNANVTEEHNVAAVPIKKAAQKGAKLLVIDPREVELTRYADVWLRPAPGSELLLLGGLLRAVVDQGLQDSDWLEERCESPATLQYALRSLDLDEVSRTTAVPQEEIEAAARLFCQSGSGAIVYGLDNIDGDLRQDCVRALADLALLTGNLGKEGSGLYPLRRGANEQGAWDMGCLPDRLPGFRTLDDDEARQETSAAWGVEPPEAPGLGVADALSGNVGQVRAVLSIGEGPAPWDNLEFLAVHCTNLGSSAERADLVLPRTSFAAKPGTFTNMERRVQLLKPAWPGQDREEGASGPRSEGQLFAQLAARMSAPGFDFASVSEVMDEIAQVNPLYRGISHARLEKEAKLVLATNPENPLPTQVLYSRKEYRGIQWPCPDESALGEGILYRDGFPGGKAELVTPEFRAAPQPDDGSALWLVPGRVLFQRERDTQVVKGRSNRIEREEWVELNPGDAGAMSIEEGDPVDVAAAGGQISGVAHLTSSVPSGVVSVTGLFGQLAVELQASEEWNPAATLEGLNIVRATVSKRVPAAV